MNNFLKINKKILLIILIAISLFFISTIIFNNINNPIDEIILSKENSNFDIINPSFTINNNKEKISVKAKRGNFLSDSLISLESNVVFKSPSFQLKTNKVIFNKNNQTAESENDSLFEAKGTVIKSEGFKITENGNIILFNGNTILIIDK